jgi:nucleotide-binding universal stress UspA family protein
VTASRILTPKGIRANELRLAGIDGEWHTVPDGDSAELIELAKSVDLTIMGQRPPSAGSDRAAPFRPEDVVIATGRPVLVVPLCRYLRDSR